MSRMSNIYFILLLLPLLQFTCGYVLPKRSQACAAAPADILFLLDSSRSEGQSNFQDQKDFVSKFVNFLDIGPSDAQVSVGSFSTIAYSFFRLNTYHNNADVLAAISRIPYKPGGTNTFTALDMAEHYSFTPQHGDRQNAPNIVYVLTDGQSSSHLWTHQAAEHLKSTGVKVFAIGIGHVSLNELIDIATDHEHVFTVDNFSDLPSIQHLVQATYCDVLLGRLCIDKVSNCNHYPKSVCTSHIAWSQMNCPDYCGFCEIHTPAPATSKPSTTKATTTTTTATTTSTTAVPKTTTNIPSTTQSTVTSVKTSLPSTKRPTPQLIPEGPCVDKVSNCAAYGDPVCSNYRTWAIENCARFCLFCHDKIPLMTASTTPLTTTTTTTNPSTTQVYDVCEDKVDQCSSYGPDICFKYTSWAAVQCPKFCVFCKPETTTMTTTTTTTPSTPAVSSITNEPCVDVRNDCANLGPNFCLNNRDYALGTCAKFCNFCTPSTSSSSQASTLTSSPTQLVSEKLGQSLQETSSVPSTTLTTNANIIIIG